MNLDEDWGQDKENDMGLGRQAGHIVEGLEYQAGKKLFSNDSVLASMVTSMFEGTSSLSFPSVSTPDRIQAVHVPECNKPTFPALHSV